MPEENKDIVNNLEKTKKSLEKAQKDLGEYQREIADSERGISLAKNLLEDIGENKIPSAIRDSLIIHSEVLSEKSEQLSKNIQESNTGNILLKISGLTDSATVTVLSAGTMTFFPTQSPPSSYVVLEDYIQQKDQRQEISQNLSFASQLATEYNQAWDALRIAPQGAVLSMREVVRNLYDHLAPKDQVKEFCCLRGIEMGEDKHGNKIVTRPNRTQYVAAKIKNSEERKLFLNEQKSYKYIYDLLCKVGKDNMISVQEAKSAMYQADNFIKRTLEFKDEILDNS